MAVRSKDEKCLLHICNFWMVECFNMKIDNFVLLMGFKIQSMYFFLYLKFISLVCFASGTEPKINRKYSIRNLKLIIMIKYCNGNLYES